MEKVTVNIRKLEDKSYEILVGRNILDQIPAELKKTGLAHSYAIISDSNVADLYGKALLEKFMRSGLRASLISFAAGEASKNRRTKLVLENKMLKLGFARDSAIIALGGGVVGDLAGFVAATYNRGIPYLQVPTTLVACVDSSIGGKTGVDTPHGKNLIGAFHQPWRVYIDVQTLDTLEEKEIREGLAEIIKYGVIVDETLFKTIENQISKVFARDPKSLISIIKRCCEIKGSIVERDERESNLRKILNFGHTVGHAIEKIYNYEMTHGEAISIGMIIEGRIAVKLGLLESGDFERLFSLLSKAGLPTEFPTGPDPKLMIDTMKLDKKARGGDIEMALPRKIGEMSDSDGKFGIKVQENLIFNSLGKI